MKILGIETSCDETSAAVLDGNQETKKVTLLSNVVASSMQLHSKTGGIIPEVAAREQIKYMLPVVHEALTKASLDTKNPQIDAIAVTIGPGLIGSLLVGVETAKTLSFVWNKPIIPVNHLFGHIYANWIEKPTIELPCLAVIISGGHTDLVVIKNHNQVTWIAGTRDDAAGEAFDKIGRLLQLPYPAGPTIEKLAKEGNPKAYNFPRPLLHEKTFDFSFSGLKTAVLREVQKLESGTVDGKNKIFSQDEKRTADPRKNLHSNKLNQQTICDLARATQDAIVDVVVQKTLKAAEEYNVSSIVLSGGVAANQTLKETFEEQIAKNQLPFAFYVPAKNLCTDNGAMIAAAAFYNPQQKNWDQITANPELYFD